ncbi:MAG: ATP-binding protein [Nocardiopsaceae bacterium]|nr:ATP-binding protein [Nocardiopsaceae bacterium]
MREMVDRDRERRQLLDAASAVPALIVVIGRRRVGKSFLLERTFTGDRVVSFQGDEQDEAHQLELFAAEVGRVLLGSDALRFGSWDSALTFLGDQARSGPLTVILDEFQWLKHAQPVLDSVIQRHWDRWDRQALPVTLILAGSALTLMEQMLEKGAPLFGRATARPRLEPLDYRDAAGFATETDPEALLRRWAVLGGTPQYQVWAGDRQLNDVITSRILAKDAALYDEPRHLLREGEGIRDSGTYLSILRAIAGGATQHNEIAQKARASSASLSVKLQRLEDLGYIERRFPLTADGKEQRPGYHIEDPFFRFWFRYVAGNRSRLERHRTDEVREEILADMDNTMGWAFERCCRRWAAMYADEGVTGSPREIGAWWSRDGQTEIDVVGTGRHRYVLLGSCKWRRTVDIDVLDQLRDHQAQLGGRAAAARLIIFGREHFTRALRERAAEEGVHLVSAADLFA